MIAYGVAETTYNSDKETWDTHKGCQLANMVVYGLGGSVFFLKSDLTDDKDKAQNECYEIRRSDTAERRGEWYRYNKYKHKFWVHEFVCCSGGWKAYIPTLAEVKCGIAYMKAHSDNEDYAAWLEKNQGIRPIDIRQELIESYCRG